MQITRWLARAGGGRPAAVTAAITMAAATALAAGAAGVAGPAQASAAASTGWRITYRHHYGPTDSFGTYFSVVAPAKDVAWAFGSGNMARNGPAVAVRWNGRHWRAVALPSGPMNAIGAASAPSRSDIWVVSQFGQSVLHWNGTKWRVAKHWKGTGLLLTGVTALSSKNVWVFGTSGEGPGLGTWHYNGHTWKHITGLGGGIVSASAVSARNIWAVGSTAQGPNNVLVHYNGTSWRLRVSAPKGRAFCSIEAISRTDVWADSFSPATPGQGRLQKWNGTSWKTMTIPWKVTPGRIVSDGHGGVWISAGSASAPGTNWVLHRTRSGSWTRTRIGTGQSTIWDLARVPGTRAVWGAGSVANTVGSDAAIYARGSIG